MVYLLLSPVRYEIWPCPGKHVFHIMIQYIGTPLIRSPMGQTKLAVLTEFHCTGS